MRVLLIDNYDSFTYNLVHLLRDIGDISFEVWAHDALPPHLTDVDKIIISPGPGLPADHPEILAVIVQNGARIPILGVCLGMQAICLAYGGSLINLPRVYHGVAGKVMVVKKDILFNGIESPFSAGRYHSWVADHAAFPSSLIMTAMDENGHPMACRHETFPVYGIQFHPESILTPQGQTMVRNFIEKG